MPSVRNTIGASQLSTTMSLSNHCVVCRLNTCPGSADLVRPRSTLVLTEASTTCVYYSSIIFRSHWLHISGSDSCFVEGWVRYRGSHGGGNRVQGFMQYHMFATHILVDTRVSTVKPVYKL